MLLGRAKAEVQVLRFRSTGLWVCRGRVLKWSARPRTPRKPGDSLECCVRVAVLVRPETPQ